ncbi:hypothetical protein [Nocardioides panacihumi]
MTALTISLASVAAIAGIVAVLALVALRRARLEAAGQVAALLERLDAVESRLQEDVQGPVVRTEHEYVITRLGELESAPAQASAPVRLAPPAFADAVLRETVVQTASLLQGVRRALAPETRYRIRFEMKRELKRSRKLRKLEAKEALREYRARHRAQMAHSEGAA